MSFRSDSLTPGTRRNPEVDVLSFLCSQGVSRKFISRIIITGRALGAGSPIGKLLRRLSLQKGTPIKALDSIHERVEFWEMIGSMPHKVESKPELSGEGIGGYIVDKAPKSPYVRVPNRLTDVLAAIQAMGTYKFHMLTFETWAERI